MSFFYDLNKKLDGIRATPEVTHKQLNERDEGKPGKNFAKIAKDAGERYGSKAAGERVAGAVRNKLKAQGKLEEGDMDEGMFDAFKAGDTGPAYAPGDTIWRGDKRATIVQLDPTNNAIIVKDETGRQVSWPTGELTTQPSGPMGKLGQGYRGLKSRLGMKEEGMSRAAKGYEKYGREGMEALAKAGREGKALDPIRKKYDKYDNEQVDEDPMDARAAAAAKRAEWARAAQELIKNPDPEWAAIHAKRAKELDDLEAQRTAAAKKPWTRNPTNLDADHDRLATGTMEEQITDEDELKYIIVNKALPTRLKNTRFTAGDDVQFGHLGEGPIDAIKKVSKRVASGVNKLVGHGSDEEMRKDLQRKSGAPVTGKKPQQQVKEKLSPAKQKSFAALAPPRDKITFADKIAGAKKEVDEMLGDVAAEAMRKALGGGKGRNAEMDEEKSKGTAFDLSTPREVKPKVGSVERGHKHDIKHTATGRMVTRRTDDQGNSVGADDDSEASGEKRGRGRPKGTKQSIGAKGPSGKSKLMTREGDVSITDQGEYDQEGDMAKDDIKTIVRHAQALSRVLGDDDNLPEWVQSKLAKIEGMMISIDEYMQNQASDDDEEPIAEKAVSKQQQKFMGMAHAMQKGEKIPGASKELKKVAKTMKKKDVEDFASTKHKGLPNKVKSKKKEEDVEESTTSGSVATSTASSGSKGGVFGKGIYDSMNRELEKMIAESMSINMSDSTEGNKSITVTATDDDAMKLAMILKSAGLGGQGSDMHSHDETCDTCGMTDCGCGDVQEAVDENAPDWPTNTETSNDALQYAGGLNKPKTDVAGDGQTTVPNTAVHTQDEDALRRMMEMAGIKQAELEPWKETMKEEDEDFFHNPTVPADKQLPATPKEIDVELDEEVEEDFLESIQRMREIAGIREAKKAVDEEKTEEGNLFTKGLEDDNVKIGDKIPGTNAIKKKDIDESIFALTNQWQAYKG